MRAGKGVSMRRSAAATRAHVLEVAHELFYWHGIHAVGVDRIAADAGIAPTTLYRVFASKDDLVAAYVERGSALYREWFDAAAASGAGPRAQVLAVFAALGAQVQPERCRGCPFLMALAEYPDPAHPAHVHASATKAWVRSRFAELAAATGAGAPDDLADDLMLVFEGVYATVASLGVHGPPRRAVALATAILDGDPGR
jgi:AcrR family transcriptional regulator